MAAGVAFAGTPAQVVEQVGEFASAVGGFEHLLMMGQGGFLDHEDTVANLTLFSEEALPAIAGQGPSQPFRFGAHQARPRPRGRRR